MVICAAARALIDVKPTSFPSLYRVIKLVAAVKLTKTVAPRERVAGAAAALVFAARLPGTVLAPPLFLNSNDIVPPAALGPPLTFQLMR